MLKNLSKFLGLLTILTVASILFGSHKAEAATLNVASGTDNVAVDSLCSLSEAIQNINDQAQTNSDCIAGDGNDDSINLPSGTILLSLDSNLGIRRGITVQGNGETTSIIDGNGIAGGFDFASVSDLDTVTLTGLKITAWNGLAINSVKGNLTLENIEIDGSGSNITGGGNGAIIVGNEDGNLTTNTISANNIYIHNISANTSYLHIFNVWTANGNTLNAIGKNINISNISNTGGGINVMVWGVGVMTFTGYGYFTGDIENTTIADITSTGGIAGIVGISLAANNLQETAISSLSVKNSTISGIDSGVSAFGVAGSFGAFGLSYDINTTSISNVEVSNVIINNSKFTGIPATCSQSDLSQMANFTGVAETNISSLGGNISDDDSCTSSFTQPTDQNNVDPANLHLGTLGDHGGPVPTIPLLPGSVAIDSGVTVAGLTTDARGVSRPQCSAYDSGAYEYDDACPSSSSQPLTYPDPIQGSTVSLVLPDSDVTNGTISAVLPSSIPKDLAFNYPLGLTNFSFNTSPGSTKTISLYYDLPGNPSSYFARKYNSTNKTFTTIQGASITRVTYNNKSQIILTYDITDNGTLDLDPTLGTIVDPVGLAQATVGVPNTGFGGKG